MTEFPISAKGDADLSGLISSFAAATAVLGTFASAAAAATTAGVGLVLIALIPAIEAAADFETEMTKLNTLVGISTEMMEDFSEAILDLAPALGQTPAELAKALFAITSGGIRSAKSIDLLVASSKAARIGLGDVTTIARVSTAVIQAFADSNLSAADAVDIMVGIVREGNLVAEELPNALGRVIGIAGEMGVTFQEVGTFMATFTRLGVSAEIAATSLRATLFALLNPGQEARDTFEEIGLSVEKMRKLIQDDGLTSAMLQLLEATHGNLDILSDLIPNIRAMSGVLGVYAAQAEQVVVIQENMNDIFGITDEGFVTVQETMKQSVNELKASVETMSVKVGQFFLPSAKAIIENLTGIVVMFGSATESALAFAFGTDLAADKLTRMNREFERSRLSAVDTFRGDTEQLEDEEILALLERVVKTREDLVGQRDLIQIGDEASLAFLDMFNTSLLVQEGVIRSIIEERKNLAGEPVPSSREFQDLIRGLDEQIDKLRFSERQLFLNRLAVMELTTAEEDEAIGRFNSIQSMEVMEEAMEDLLKKRKEMRREAELNQAILVRQTQRIRDQMRADRESALDDEAALATELMVSRIEIAMRQQERIMEAVARATLDAFEDMIRGTLSVTEAFRDMVTGIIAEFARLKLQEFITPFLADIFFPIPNAPGAIPAPDDPTLGLGLPDFSSGAIPISSSSNAVSGQTVIVHQTINFSPNLIDGRSGQQFIREHGGEITRIIAQAARESGDFAARIG